MPDLTWTDEAGSIYYIPRAVTAYSVEQIANIQYDVDRERLLHYAGCYDVDVDYRLIEAQRHLADAARLLRSYVEECDKEDAEHAEVQRQISSR